MGLLELLQQGQTQLSAGSYPGDAPINDPQSGFVQDNSPSNTYDDETIGQPNNGSALVNTLNDTALDNTEGASTTNTFPPQSNTLYPSLASGIFGYYASQFTEPYGPTDRYLWFGNINDIVDIETNPQVLTLPQTSLDNTDPESISLTINPLSVDTSYPFFARGKWRANALPFSQLWNSGYGYASYYSLSPSLQSDTLNKTSLDNTLPERENTTYPIPNATSYPNDYVTLGNLPPQVGMGAFGFGPGQYNSNYTGTGGYYSQNNYNNIIITSNNLLVITTPQSGLSIDNNETATFIQSYPYNQTYLGNPGFPEFVTGDWGLNPNLFNQYYTPNYNYISEIQNFGGYHGEEELSRTSLDNTNPDNLNGIVPNSINAPNNYPLLVSGEWDGAPSQYESLYNANNTYLGDIFNNTSQINTLGQTSLDNTNSTTVSNTITPSSNNFPNTYPPLVSGEFNGAPSQYQSIYSSTNTYLNNVPVESETSRQKDTVLSGETALDNTLPQSILTTTPPNSITSPTIYPVIPQTNLGEFNGSPSQYQTVYTPNSTYLDQYGSIIGQNSIESNPQVSSLKRTGMDVENGLYDEVAIFPANPDNITVYPAANVTGITGSAPQSFNQVWKPVKRYYNDYIKSLKDQNLV